jgi:uncharacterized protein (TIGR03437 family)
VNETNDLSQYPQLRVASGGQAGQFLAIGGASGERRLGSGRGCHLRLAGANVEDLHARLLWDDRGVFLHDAGTFAGTFVNGERLEAAWDLGNGDRISLGPPGSPDSVKLIAQLPDRPSAFPPPPLPVVEESASAVEEPLPLVDAVAEPEPELLVEAAPEPEIAGAPHAGAAPATAAAPLPAAPRTPEPPQAVAPLPPAVPPAEPAAKPATKPHKPEKADLLEQPEIIGAARPRTVPARAPLPRPTKPPARRAALVAVAAAALAALGFYAYQLSHKPAPVLLSVLPPKAEPGQRVVLKGAHFASDTAANAVFFGDLRSDVVSAGENELAVSVPANLPPGDERKQHKIRVEARGQSSNSVFFTVYLAPRVTGFEPEVAMPGDQVTVRGENFDESTTVSVGGARAEIVEAQPASLRFKMPELALPQGRVVAVQVLAGSVAARQTSLIIGRLPLVMEIVPARGLPGDRVKLKGHGFDPAAGGTAVRVAGRPALVLAATPTEVDFVVPGSSAAGLSEATISVRALGATSSGASTFTFSRASTLVFTPRFFAEPAAGDDVERALVSSELGPLLQLGGKGDAPTTAERAARVAAQLNILMDAAAKQTPAIELREKPEPAVAVKGGAVVVTATPADAATYAGRPLPRALGRYWAALVEDYLALFGQRQRPYRTLELNPRGRALLDLFAESERRMGEAPGVPTAAIDGLSSAQRAALAELATSVPGDSHEGGGAAVAGRWEGSLDVAGQGARKIQVRLRTAGAGLEGQFTTSWGGVSVDMPVQAARYERGALSFSVALGGALHTFSGAVEGRTISGSVSAADKKAAGRFSLRWVE